MVRIPGGTFAMGADDGYAEESPVHQVTVPPFLMDIVPVTNAAYRAFCDATGHPVPTPPRWADMPNYLERYPEHPVVNISHADAAACAAWCGKRLPTEAEWEFAARGGAANAAYPWGSDDPGTWARRRNDHTGRINWQFTTADARIKLRRLYPAFED